LEKAIAIVTNKGPDCTDSSPAVEPNFFGSSVFVYSPNSADAFRKNVLAPFFAKKNASIDATAFYNKLKSLLDGQLGSTLVNLSPANAIDLVSVEITSSHTPSPTISNSPRGPFLSFAGLLATVLLYFHFS
jgi:hypothetical protein